MIVPSYWSEAKRSIKLPSGQQRSLRRFGWSDLSERDALQLAEQRLEAAIQEAIAGNPVETRDRKVPYNGSDGVPIREEIVERFGDHLITRNSYGALCLNTPDVLFADIDAADQVPKPHSCLAFLLLAALGAGAAALLQHWLPLLIAAVLYIAWTNLEKSHLKQLESKVGDRLKERLREYGLQHPESRLRLYQTPAGYRILAMHQEFNPTDESTQKLLEQFGSDKLYVTMCRRQACFRARVSPKPWRVGLGEHMKPRPGVWPIRPERMPDREAWVLRYIKACQGYASCRFIEEFGQGRSCRRALEVKKIHDQLCHSDSGEPIA